ncbi:MAG TPA: TrmH family RNA methyltransferase [Bacteriovoracaceae bacterium]|nr:TrmH family RNA methyltransferase [Bacteriovoracaceae bacterium]
MKHTKKNLEMKVYGRHACLALFQHRPQDIIRAYVTRDGVFEFRQLIRFCVDNKLAYHVVEKEEIDSVTRATHHEGIALVVKTKKLPTVKEMLTQPERSLILALEEVENPHNLGAIMRTGAHYGVNGILYEAKVPVALTASAHRTAEGGAETVPALHLDGWGDVFDYAKQFGYKLFGTSGHEGESLFKTEFPEKTIIFLGAEGVGLSDRLLKKMHGLVKIPGTGAVESLNVSNATAAVLTEWYRQGHK